MPSSYTDPRWTDEQVAIALYAYGAEHLAKVLDSELLAALARDPVTTFLSRLTVPERDTYRAAAMRIRERIVPDHIPADAGLIAETV